MKEGAKGAGREEIADGIMAVVCKSRMAIAIPAVSPDTAHANATNASATRVKETFNSEVNRQGSAMLHVAAVGATNAPGPNLLHEESHLAGSSLQLSWPRSISILRLWT